MAYRVEKMQHHFKIIHQIIMEKSQFEELKNGVQEIIDFIAAKDNKSANNKLLEVSEKLDHYLDHTDEDEDLIEISKYQVLVNQLFSKINPEEVEGE